MLLEKLAEDNGGLTKKEIGADLIGGLALPAALAAPGMTAYHAKKGHGLEAYAKSLGGTVAGSVGGALLVAIPLAIAHKAGGTSILGNKTLMRDSAVLSAGGMAGGLLGHNVVKKHLTRKGAMEE